MNPEISEHLDKARDCLTRGRIILAAGVGKDAGRNAYLAAFHAAQALILGWLGRIAKTHRGVHELGPDADVPLDRAGNTLDIAEEFIQHVAALLG